MSNAKFPNPEPMPRKPIANMLAESVFVDIEAGAEAGDNFQALRRGLDLLRIAEIEPKEILIMSTQAVDIVVRALRELNSPDLMENLHDGK